MRQFLLALTLGALSVVTNVLSAADAGAKPLKIFVLAGQSNMQGYARVRTLERLNLTEDSKQMYLDMGMKDGLPSPVKNVYGVYFTGGALTKGEELKLDVQKGPFMPGYGSKVTTDTTFGPDYTFGLYMQKHVQGPILIIKTAWGGRDLLKHFRPPSAGPYEQEKDSHGNPIGHYYQSIVKHVKNVLADPSQYHPGYDKKAGYEIAGFVWFQGFNDLVNNWYAENKIEGRPLFAQYSDLMAAFIRDIRKDLNAPEMPFIIGVMGLEGPIEDTQNKQYALRQAQMAPADLPEFKGNVVAVRTEFCWDMEWQRIQNKLTEAVEKKILASDPKMAKRALGDAVSKELKTMAPQVLTADELKLYQVATSNQGFHYMGSGYTFGKIGKAFAEAMIQFEKNEKK
jgi:alpha-galactosidase